MVCIASVEIASGQAVLLAWPGVRVGGTEWDKELTFRLSDRLNAIEY